VTSDDLCRCCMPRRRVETPPPARGRKSPPEGEQRMIRYLSLATVAMAAFATARPARSGPPRRLRIWVRAGRSAKPTLSPRAVVEDDRRRQGRSNRHRPGGVLSPPAGARRESEGTHRYRTKIAVLFYNTLRPRDYSPRQISGKTISRNSVVFGISNG
jgi:hypothetical protein